MASELKLTDDEMNWMKEVQDAHMMDMGKVRTFSAGTVNGYGIPANSWVDGVEIACGFQFANRTDEVQGETDVVVIDAKLRLLHGTAITSQDRFLLMRRMGVVLPTAENYEVVGQPRQGPSGLYIDLARVLDGST